MSRLLHLSDLHFGAHEPELVEAVERRIDEEKPDLVVISGDFTQRARTSQFKEACDFLGRLRDRGHDVLGVPGNHDVPLYDVLRRFLSPLTRYKRFIDETPCPFYELPGATVTAVPLGITALCDTFDRNQSPTLRIMVTHHPLFALPVGEGAGLAPAVGRHQLALDAIADAGVDLLLSGHHHHHSVHSARELATRAGPALVIQAGTATSHRLREQNNSFNRIEIDGDAVKLTVFCWSEGRFAAADAQRFIREGDHWRLAGAELTEAAH